MAERRAREKGLSLMRETRLMIKKIVIELLSGNEIRPSSKRGD